MVKNFALAAILGLFAAPILANADKKEDATTMPADAEKKADDSAEKKAEEKKEEKK